jgi:hypothetical protein
MVEYFCTLDLGEVSGQKLERGMAQRRAASGEARRYEELVTGRTV